MTGAQKSALLWLRNRNGDGVFDLNGVLLAAGETAPVMRSTWNALIELGYVQKYDRKRLCATNMGQSVDLRGVEESQGPRDFD